MLIELWNYITQSVCLQTSTCKCPLGKILDASGRTCISDMKPFLMLVQKTNIFGLSMDDAVNGTPSLCGMIPLAGLSNAYDADYDPESAEVMQTL